MCVCGCRAYGVFVFFFQMILHVLFFSMVMVVMVMVYKSHVFCPMGFSQVGVSGISMFSGQAPVLARAIASAKAMKKAPVTNDQG